MLWEEEGVNTPGKWVIFKENLQTSVFTHSSSVAERLILLNTQRRRPCCPRAFSPAFFQSRTAVHLFRPHLENMWLFLLQNGSRTLRWLERRLPAMLPTSRRPTETLRQDLQSPVQWGKNVSSQLSKVYVWHSCYPQWLIMSFTKLSSDIVVCFPELVPRGVFLWWGLVMNRQHQASVCYDS